MSRPKCSVCGKPLGNTLGQCHEHGGRNYRAGPSFDGLISYLLGR